MRRFVLGVFMAMILTAAGSSFAQEKTMYVAPKPESAYWGIDSVNTKVLFTLVESGFVDVWGDIPGTAVSGGAEIDDRDFTRSKFNITLKPSELTTRDVWDDKMKGGEGGLEVEKYPTMTFVSKKITSDKGKIQVVGALTMHGITKDVTLDLDTPTRILAWRGERYRSFQGRTVINRKDFGVNWVEPEHFDIPLLSDQIRILAIINLVNPPRDSSQTKSLPQEGQTAKSGQTP